MEYASLLIEISKSLRNEILGLNQLLDILWVDSLAEIISSKKAELRAILSELFDMGLL